MTLTEWQGWAEREGRMTIKPSDTHQAHVCSFRNWSSPTVTPNTATLPSVFVLGRGTIVIPLLILLTKAENSFSISSDDTHIYYTHSILKIFKDISKTWPRHSPSGISMEPSGPHSLQNPWSGLQRTWTRYFFPGCKLRILNWVCCPAKWTWGGARKTEVTLTCVLKKQTFPLEKKLLEEWGQTIRLSRYLALTIPPSQPIPFHSETLFTPKLTGFLPLHLELYFRKTNILHPPHCLQNSTLQKVTS